MSNEYEYNLDKLNQEQSSLTQAKVISQEIKEEPRSWIKKIRNSAFILMGIGAVVGITTPTGHSATIDKDDFKPSKLSDDSDGFYSNTQMLYRMYNLKSEQSNTIISEPSAASAPKNKI